MKFKLIEPRVPFKEKMFFIQHLGVMLKASIPIDQTISSLASQTKNKSFKKILNDLIENIQKGKTLSEGMEAHTSVFGDFFISMIQAGEQTGKMVEALERLHHQMKKTYDLKSKVKSALAYPIFVIIAMFGIGTAIMLFVVPKLIGLFENFQTQLPLATRILIGVSKILTEYTLWIALILIVGIGVFIKLIKGPMKTQWHGFLLKVPGISRLIQDINLARFSRTFASLLGTDILVIDALKITSRVVNNEKYKSAILKSQDDIQQGITIAESFKKYDKLFPQTVLTMIKVGEESGTLSDLLEEIASFYEEEVDEFTKTISSIIEPALIVILGVAVGGIALAILMPMYALIQQV